MTAETLNGVWVGQEPTWEIPINRGTHCAKGASVRELVHSERRLRDPMKIVERRVAAPVLGKAVNEIAHNTAYPEKYGSRFRLLARLGQVHQRRRLSLRKLGAFWGTNNSDHQARICHSTTVAGVANTWGYGAIPRPTTTSATPRP